MGCVERMDYPGIRGIRPRLVVGPDLPDGPGRQEMSTEISRMTRETSASVPILGVLSPHWTSPHRPGQGERPGRDRCVPSFLHGVPAPSVRKPAVACWAQCRGSGQTEQRGPSHHIDGKRPRYWAQCRPPGSDPVSLREIRPLGGEHGAQYGMGAKIMRNVSRHPPASSPLDSQPSQIDDRRGSLP
jgi:hypothetical protein